MKMKQTFWVVLLICSFESGFAYPYLSDEAIVHQNTPENSKTPNIIQFIF
jgi:hypothetical protein